MAALAKVRWMIRSDLEPVLRIERKSYDKPWSEEEWLEFLRTRRNVTLVAELDGKVVGYIGYAMLMSSLDIINITVAPKHRGQGIGRLMIEKLQSKLSERNRHVLSHTVAEDNLGGQMFLKACGFKATKIIFDSYGEGRDGYVMDFHFLDLPDYIESQTTEARK